MQIHGCGGNSYCIRWRHNSLTPRGQESRGSGWVPSPSLMAHSACGTDALFCFLALKESDHIQVVDGFLKIRKQNLNRHDKPWCTDTLAGKNVSFLCQPFIVLSGKYAACQGDLLFAYTQKYTNIQHCLSGKAIRMRQPGLKKSNFSSVSFSRPLKKKEYICISWKVVPESCWWQTFRIIHCHKQAKTLARGLLRSPGTWLSAEAQLGAAPPRALCSSAPGVGEFLMLPDGTFWKNLNAFK